MVDIDAAIGYVVAHGDPVERARLSYLRAGTAAPEHIVERIAEDVTPSGGWPASGAGQSPSVDATCYRIRELDDLGGMDGTPAQRALTWLLSVQRGNGTWQEDPSLAAEAPVWAMPGDPEATLYLTAMAGFWLAVAQRGAEFEPALQAAAGFVAAQIQPDGTWPSFLATGWHAAGLLHRRHLYYESARIQIVLGERLDDMSPANVASMAAVLRRVDLGGDWLLPAARKRLTETQRTDGGWDSDEGPVFDVNTTLTAIRACIQRD